MTFTIEQFDVSDWIVLENQKPLFMIKDHDAAIRLVNCLNSHAKLAEKLFECSVVLEMEARTSNEHRAALIQKCTEIKDLLENLPRK